MPINEIYRRQVQLLVRLLPIVANEECFALKGGTAINLFIRSLPRLSIDIDLIYLPMHTRPKALSEIDAAMKRIDARIQADIYGSCVSQQIADGAVTRLSLIHI